MRTAVFYTTSRILLFVVVLLLLDLAGARGLLLIALALLISGLLSYVVLSRQRDSMAGALSGRLSRRRTTSFRDRLNEGARAEDADEGSGEDPASATPAPASSAQVRPPSATDQV